MQSLVTHGTYFYYSINRNSVTYGLVGAVITDVCSWRISGLLKINFFISAFMNYQKQGYYGRRACLLAYCWNHLQLSLASGF